MRSLIILEIIGCVSIFSIWNTWVISYREHIIGLAFILLILLAYFIVNSQIGLVTKSIRYIVFAKYKNNLVLGAQYLLELRKIGIYTGIFGLGGIPGIFLLNSWTSIGINIIGGGIAVTGAIILYTLMAEVLIILPLIMGITLKESNVIIIR